MKKIIAIFFSLIIIISSYSFFNATYAEDKVLDNKLEGEIIKLKETSSKSIEDYKARYGTDAYGLTAYILNIVRIYSIPLCFLGIVMGVIKRYIIGIRKLDTLEQGLGLIVTSVTLLIICQILPLAFAVFVKFGRG